MFVFCCSLGCVSKRRRQFSQAQVNVELLLSLEKCFCKLWHLATAILWPATNTVEYFFFFFCSAHKISSEFFSVKSLESTQCDNWYQIVFGSIQRSLLSILVARSVPHSGFGNLQRGASVGLPRVDRFGPSRRAGYVAGSLHLVLCGPQGCCLVPLAVARPEVGPAGDWLQGLPKPSPI